MWMTHIPHWNLSKHFQVQINWDQCQTCLTYCQLFFGISYKHPTWRGKFNVVFKFTTNIRMFCFLAGNTRGFDLLWYCCISKGLLSTRWDRNASLHHKILSKARVMILCCGRMWWIHVSVSVCEWVTACQHVCTLSSLQMRIPLFSQR